MLEPKPFEVKTLTGETLTVLLSKFPCIVGREIVTQYPVSAAPKVGSYERNEELMFKLMRYVGIEKEDGVTMMINRALIESHIPDAETLMRIEYAMLEYNTSFFQRGNLSTILESMVSAFTDSILQTLKDSKLY